MFDKFFSHTLILCFVSVISMFFGYAIGINYFQYDIFMTNTVNTTRAFHKSGTLYIYNHNDNGSLELNTKIDFKPNQKITFVTKIIEN